MLCFFVIIIFGDHKTDSSLINETRCTDTKNRLIIQFYTEIVFIVECYH